MISYKLVSVLSFSLLASTSSAVQSGSVSYDWCMKYHNNEAKCKVYKDCRLRKRREAVATTQNPHELQKGQRQRFRECLVEAGLPRNPGRR